MSSEKTENFAKAYENLKNIADLMRSRDIDDVDELLKHVEDGTKSYKVCKERLELAEKKLKDILDDVDVANQDKTVDVSSDNISVTKKTKITDDEIPF